MALRCNFVEAEGGTVGPEQDGPGPCSPGCPCSPAAEHQRRMSLAVCTVRPGFGTVAVVGPAEKSPVSELAALGPERWADARSERVKAVEFELGPDSLCGNCLLVFYRGRDLKIWNQFSEINFGTYIFYYILGLVYLFFIFLPFITTV